MLRSASDSRFPVSPIWSGLLSEKIAARNAVPLPKAGWVEDSKVHQLCGGQVLVPSGGFANDSTRARNTGRRLALQPPSPVNRLTKAASESKLSGSGSLPSAGLQGVRVSPVLEAKTPRTVRGLVRKHSTVVISYPTIPHASPSTSSSCVVRWCAGTVLKLSPDAKAAPAPVDSVPLMMEGYRKEAISRPNTAQRAVSSTVKRVSWADKVDQEESSTTSLTHIEKEGTPSKARVRSMMLLDNLYKLRRVGGTDSPPAVTDIEHEAPLDKEEEEQMTLMRSILTGLEDTEAELRTTEAQLQGAQEPVHEFGGARHATTLVSGRTLSVVQRKAELLKITEAQLAAFEAAHAQREQLRRGVIDGVVTVPEEYKGVKQFIAKYGHRDFNGYRAEPVDADKTHFEAFASSFGLPWEHGTLVRLRNMGVEATEWWATATLDAAHKGADSFVLQRLINVTVGFLNIATHEKLKQVTIILGDRLSEKCLNSAQRLQAKDAQFVARSPMARPESAREAADQIDAEIREAVALGAPPKHPMLANAKSIAVELHAEEKIRHALRALQFAEKMIEKDTAMAEKAAPNVAPVGPASEMADQIEREIRDAIKKGALEAHPHLVDATKLCKQLRDEDGVRKRMAAREKRLAAKAAAETAA